MIMKTGYLIEAPWVQPSQLTNNGCSKIAKFFKNYNVEPIETRSNPIGLSYKWHVIENGDTSEVACECSRLQKTFTILRITSSSISNKDPIYAYFDKSSDVSETGSMKVREPSGKREIQIPVPDHKFC